jgi:hypothetical protein
MSVIFNGNSYSVILNKDHIVFRPDKVKARVLILTPPSVKPQFFSILAVLLTKANIEVVMPKLPLPCDQIMLKDIVMKIINLNKPDLVLIMGFDIDKVNMPKVTLGFNENVMNWLMRQNIPGSVYESPANDCDWFRTKKFDADLVISEDQITLNSIIKIKEFLLNRISTLPGLGEARENMHK